MSIRQDQAQLIITIDSKESVEYQKSVERSAELVRNMKKLEEGTDEYNAALREQIEISKRLSGQDYSKLSLKNLTDRKKALQDQIRILPQAQSAELGLERELQRVNQALATNAQRTRAVNSAIVENSRSAISWRNIYAIGTGILIGAGAAVATITARFEKYSAVLKVALGSQEASDQAMKLVKETAADTTFTVDELTESYVKFANRGIKLTKAEMISLADLAASQGKSFLQLTEAILDAQTGEFERLKEFGIRGSKSGDQATLSFKGFNETVALTPAAMKDALISMGRLDGITGANAEQMTKLTGRYSNFQDTLDGLLNAAGGKASGFFGRTLGVLTDYGKKLTELIAPTKSAADQTRSLQSEFNTEIGILKRLSPEAEGRKALIDKINVQYKDYLPNLIAESANLADIEKAQRGANKAFEEKLIYLAFEEELQKQLDKTKQAVKQLAGAELSRARAAQANSEFGSTGATGGQIAQQKAIAENFIGVIQTNAQAVVDSNQGAIDELEKSYDTVAKRIGSSLDKIRDKFAKTTEAASPSSSSGSGESNEAKKAREKAEKDAAALLKKKLELQIKERDALLAFNPLNPEFAQGVLDLRLKMLEDAADREQLALEESYLQGKISLEQYEIEKLRITSANLATRIELLDAFGQTETDKRRELNVELLKVDSDLMAERAAQIADMENLALSDVEQRFAERLISEEEYNLSRLKVQLNFYDEQLRLLEESGLTETEVYKQILDDRLKTQTDYNNQKIDNEKRTAALQEAIQRDGVDAAKDIFSLGAELLGQDEKARKKHATAIKAFESSAILINALSEISAIHKKYAAIPGGTIVAIGQSIATAVRAGIAIAKVNSQKFAYGGTLRDGGVFQGASHQYGGVKFSVGGEINEAEGGETIINKRSSQVFARELDYINSYKGYGRRLFNDGGIVRLPNTQPSLSSGVINPQQILSAPDGRLDMLMGIVSEMAAAVSSIPGTIAGMDLKTHVVYSDLQGAQSTVDEIKRLASY